MSLDAGTDRLDDLDHAPERSIPISVSGDVSLLLAEIVTGQSVSSSIISIQRYPTSTGYGPLWG
jgi:hypothetical protein